MIARKCGCEGLALVHLACMLLGSSAIQLISNSALGLNKSSTSRFDTCTCQFTIDNDIDLVYVDQSDSPIDVTADVIGSLSNWYTTKSLSFDCESTTLLALKGSDRENGCSSGGFAMMCESTDPSSPWHYRIADASWKVWGTTCTSSVDGTCPNADATYASTPGGWYQRIFSDIAWEDASETGRDAVAERGASRLSTCSSSGPAWLFRSPYLGPSWFLLRFGDIGGGGGCASFASYCTAAACRGDRHSDLRLASCDKTDPYQLFKLQAGRLVSAAPGYRCVYMDTSYVHMSGEPYTLAGCDWGDARQEFVTETYEGSTVWRNTATSRAMANENGNNMVGNKIMGFMSTNNWGNFNPIPAKAYVVTRRVKAGADARAVCGSFGSLAMPKSAEEQAALEADLAAYSGTTPLAYIGGQYINGSWMWDDGTPVIYAKWERSEPTSFPWLCIDTRTFLWGSCKDNEFYAALCNTGQKPAVQYRVTHGVANDVADHGITRGITNRISNTRVADNVASVG